MRLRLGYGLALAALMIIGCASFPVNPPLKAVDYDAGYRFRHLSLGEGNTKETFVVLTLSGGGTRAAAFAYGVMRALDEIEVPASGGTLLDEVDVISSVSGGSFAAAYYGAFGKRAFLKEFPDAVLHRKIERALALRILAPWNWPRLLSYKYGRSDLADAYYDRHIFRGIGFADLPAKRPQIILNATDLSLGAQFSFTQDQFDRLCSDLSQIKLSRGVVASSAFPIGFTPVTIRNYPSRECGYKTPDWVNNAIEFDLETNALLYDRAQVWKSYEDPERAFIHLNDGGLADNIGLRPILLDLRSPAAPLGLIRKMNNGEVNRIVFIIVDAKTEEKPKRDRSPRPPGIINVLSTSATNPMENYSADTIELSRDVIAQLRGAALDEEANRQSCVEFAAELCRRIKDNASCESELREKCFEFFEVEKVPKIAFHRIHLRFEADTLHAEELKKIGTRLQLCRDEVEMLVDAGGRLLWASPGFRCLAHILNPSTYPLQLDYLSECPEQP
jgi:NTE family protein